jgi:hypothetical protein
MPKPISPIVPGVDLPEVVLGKNQPEYQPLPVYYADDGMVLTRWKLTWKERLLCLLYGDVYLFQLTFHQPLQPCSVEIERPKITQP